MPTKFLAACNGNELVMLDISDFKSNILNPHYKKKEMAGTILSIKY